MKSLFTKFLGTALLALAFCALILTPVQAGGGGIYNWTDLSSQVSPRQNRPVWAMAYAEPYWYFTDGQELWSGGHVWRTDGLNTKDVTLDVRNAGLSRVDDIVSDGKTIVYLKNVTARNNNFEMLAYLNNGTYSYPAYALRQNMSSDEGIASLNGKDGVWSVVTTKGRVLFWNFVNNTGGSFMTSSANWQSNHSYSLRKISPADHQSYLPTISQPTNGGWLVGTRESDGRMRYFLRRDNGVSVDLSLKFNTYSTVAMAISNGTNVLIVTTDNRAYSIEGENVTDRTNEFQYYRNDYSYLNNNSAQGANFAWNRAIGAWDGWKFLVVSGKSVSHFAPAYGTFSQREATNDYFVTMSGNNRGTILLGGAVSTSNNSQPSSPLTAKLLKAIDSNSSDAYTAPSTNNGSFGGNRTYTSANGPTITTSGNPSNFTVGNGHTFIYRVTATDSQGVDRIDLYVNGARLKTCTTDVCEYSNTYYTNGASTRSVSFMARSTDRSGWSTETNTETLTIDQSSNTAGTVSTGNTGTGNGTITNGPTSVWDWVTPSVTSLRRSENTTFGVGAWNAKGLNRIELWVNGSVRKTCTSDFTNCTTTLYGSDYGVGSTVSFNAKVVASNGQETWTNLRNVSILSDNGSTNGNNNNSNSNGSVSVWLEGANGTWTLSNGASATYKVTAQDIDGVNRIEIVIDGTVAKTCYASSCDYIVASSINGTTSKTIYARMFDLYGNMTQSSTSTINFVNNQYNQNYSAAAYINTDHCGTAQQNPRACGNLTKDTLNFPTNASMSVYAFAVNGCSTFRVSKIELWVNGNLVESKNSINQVEPSWCTVGAPQYGGYASTQFSLPLWAYAQNNQRALQLYTRMISDDGRVLTSSTITRYIDGTSTTNPSVLPANYPNTYPVDYTAPTNSNTAGTLTVSSNFDAGFYNTSLVTVTAKGVDADGISKIEVLVNGSLAKTCSNVATCSVTAGPFGSLTSASYAARMTDAKGMVTTTPYTIISHR